MSSFKRAPSEAFHSDETEEQRTPSKRRPTVYDAVAGRVTRNGVNSTTSRTPLPLRPDEVLYKAQNAPPRYEETDHYFAHTHLPSDQQLPSSDLLSAIHAYISNFYARSEENVNQKVWKCMDETALIALGILMEESAREVIGETGDLVFTEGMEADEGEVGVRSDGEEQSEGDKSGRGGERDGSDDGMSEGSVELSTSEESDEYD